MAVLSEARARWGSSPSVSLADVLRTSLGTLVLRPPHGGGQPSRPDPPPVRALGPRLPRRWPRRRERVARAGRVAEGDRLAVAVRGYEHAVRLRPSAHALAARMRPRGWMAPSSPGPALTALEAGTMVRPMTRRKLPIGIQTFRTIREEGWYYVDKTAYACRLVDEGIHYFLSRPRRFGKSLFVDTLKELFEGNEPLFRGLAVHDRWDWSVRHPVVRLDFSVGDFSDPSYLHDDVLAQLAAIERRAGLGPGHARASIRFRQLLEALHERTGQRVAVLVDEYDRPILDALAKPETARANRDALRGLYSAIKASARTSGSPCLRGSASSPRWASSPASTTSSTSLWIPVTPPSAAIPTRTWTPCSHRSSRARTATRSAAGTTAMAGGAGRRSTTRSTSCCCSGSASSRRTGSRPGRRGSTSTRCCAAASPPRSWTG